MKPGIFSVLTATVFSVLVLSSCHNNTNSKSVVYIKDIKEYIMPEREAYKLPEWDLATCKEPVDTLWQNLPYTYYEAIATLRNKFIAVDQAPLNNQTNQFIKALICADFVYAAFSYHYPADTFGFVSDTVSTPGWDSLPLNICYDLGNKNRKAVYCYDRSIFYLRLLRELTGTGGKLVNRGQIHTFPVLFIGDEYGNSKTYMIDPYDPFIHISQGDSVVAEFNIPGGQQYGNEIYRTRKVFGKTRVIVSTGLIAGLSKNGYPSQYCSLPLYTKDLLGKLHIPEDSDLINLPRFTRAKILPENNRFSYTIEMDGRPDGQLYDLKSFRRYYDK